MPYYVAGLVDTEDALIARTPETFRKKFSIDVETKSEVLSIDPDRQQVLVRDLDSNREKREPYDQLLIATGAGPLRPQLPGIDASNIHDVNSLTSGSRLKRILGTDSPKSAVIVGGGYIGLEMAEALHMRGLKVTMIQRGPQLMPSLDPDMGELLAASLLDSGISLFRKEAVTGFEQKSGAGGPVTGVQTQARTVPADLVVLGLGVRPNSSFAADAGIPLGPRGSIRVNELQQTETENIWAAGDCAQAFHLVSRRPTHVALGTIANKQGRVAGMNLGGSYATFPGIVGTAITKFMDTECARTGLSEKEITALGWHYVVGRIEANTLPRYYPGSQPMTVKVLAEKGSGRLLGAQIVGGRGSAKRIDVAATALHAGFSLDDMLYLDLSYAPPFSGVYDPLVIAARMALKQV